MAFIKATKCHHRTSTRSEIIKGTSQCREFAIVRVSGAGDGTIKLDG
jgi:hypothetical protein